MRLGIFKVKEKNPVNFTPDWKEMLVTLILIGKTWCVFLICEYLGVIGEIKRQQNDVRLSPSCCMSGSKAQ